MPPSLIALLFQRDVIYLNVSELSPIALLMKPKELLALLLYLCLMQLEMTVRRFDNFGD